MSFRNFTTGKSHAFGGEYVELVAGERMRYTNKFDDPGTWHMLVTVWVLGLFQPFVPARNSTCSRNTMAWVVGRGVGLLRRLGVQTPRPLTTIQIWTARPKALKAAS